MFRILRLALAVLAFVPGGVIAAAPAKDMASPGTRAGQTAARGRFADAITLWRGVRDSSRASPHERVAALIGLAECYWNLGELRLARAAAEGAAAEVVKNGEHALGIEVDCVLGAILARSSKEADRVEGGKRLRAAVAATRRGSEAKLGASARNNLALSVGGQGKYAEALSLLQEAQGLARQAADPTRELECLANIAAIAGQALQLPRAAEAAATVLARSPAAPASHRHALAVLRAGTVFETLDGREEKPAARLQALHAYQRAEEIAESLEDQPALAQALLAQGRLYERERRWSDALPLTRRAVFLAQKVRSADLLFRAEWQAGRLLREMNDRPAALAAMERAEQSLGSVRNDVALHYGQQGSGGSFREVTGGLYFDLADLYLQKANDAPAAELQELLGKARDAAEALKAGELEDYFQDECSNLLRQKTVSFKEVEPHAVLIYIIPLPDRTELLVTAGSTIERVRSGATAAQIEKAATRMRRTLENRVLPATEGFRPPAEQLNGWLIAPLQSILERVKPSTLVFVPGGALRTIPMGALHSGKRFLIQDYAVAVVPGLTLLEPKPLTRAPSGAEAAATVPVLLGGVSEAWEDFAALPFVPEELAGVRKAFGGEQLLNSDFVYDRLNERLEKEPCRIVHFATHGHFDHDAAKTFVLAYHQKLTLDDLERLIRPLRLREQPVELLTLSACETAAGDDQAALGLAGVAVKAGARSALATLWFVNDAASARLVSGFYEELRRSPEINKAQALQRAQVRLLGEAEYQHPCYWAPYLLIGNWL